MESYQAANVIFVAIIRWTAIKKLRVNYPGENRYGVLYQLL